MGNVRKKLSVAVIFASRHGARDRLKKNDAVNDEARGLKHCKRFDVATQPEILILGTLTSLLSKYS